MKKDLVAVGNTGAPALRRALTPAQFGDLAQVPPELEWLANLTTRGDLYCAHKRKTEADSCAPPTDDRVIVGSPNGFPDWFSWQIVC